MSRINQIFESAESEATEDYDKGKVKDEDGMTVSLIKELSICERFDVWGKNILLDIEGFQGPEEGKSGADIGIRYQVCGPEIDNVSRGIVAQAKMYGSSRSRRLSDQCARMLKITDESYVFTYSPCQIRVAPALPIYLDDGRGGKFKKYLTDSFQSFMKEYTYGFHGDRKVARKMGEPLTDLPDRVEIDYLLDIKVGISEEKYEDFDFDYVNRNYFSDRF